MHIKVFLQIYLKIQSIRSSFAFSYANKFPQLSKIKHHQIINEFVRLGFAQNKDFHIIDNTSFSVCLTYPQLTVTFFKISVCAHQNIRSYDSQNWAFLELKQVSSHCICPYNITSIEKLWYNMEVFIYCLPKD